ncbi:thioesterase II family protein [Streptomyces pinistramenti]|uniref:thioesterase II family protein n=1 Tax=Streptomyces pinistramenti TaxID=2884812 RepID=UPI001D08A83F|nr:alpha/beta fold hydrolase [Streptomyces pinistramenti]MCB5906115.1 alpha/beta fold hydrolase [Streptomyces pinistramenti]
MQHTDPTGTPAPALPDPSADPWIRRFRPAPESRVRLVCFPHAGGAASFYLPLARQLPPGIEAWSLQYPGRQERRTEAPFTAIPELADAAFDALRPHLTEPFAFFGHSMGSIVAFEVARRCERAGLPGPVRLFVSARRAPSDPRRKAIRLLDDDGLVAELERLGGTAPGVLADAELRAMVLPAVRADYHAIETYVCGQGERVNCPLTVLSGDADPSLAVADAPAWQQHTTAECEVSVYSGGHFYLEGHVPEVAERIGGALLGTPAG